ncbi:MAG: VWA domain-containing protein [Acidimicrobiia bacterium]
MIEVVSGFVHELREAGIPVSMVEAIDAIEALAHTDISNRADFRSALASTLVKSERHYDAFDVAFDVYFGLRPREEPETAPGLPPAGTEEGGSGGSISEALFLALLDGDQGMVRALARTAVSSLAGIQPGRPVGGTYYLYRVLRAIDTDQILERLMAEEQEDSPLQQRLLREEYERRLAQFRAELEAEIRRRLVADRGPKAVARTLRRPLLEDVDLMHASRIELKQLERAVHPLTRKLAARLARRRKTGRLGRLDFRRTIRSSLSVGGVPVEPRFRRPHPSKPDVFVICDISGSMSTFARFTLQFVYAMANQFSRLRSFVFIDALDEATDAFRGGGDLSEALHRVSTESEVVWLDGHSDYGHALEEFWESYGDDLTPRTTVIVAGDGRNNYRAPRDELLAQVRERSRAVYWLNPEPRSYWDTGDSVMSSYAPHCDEVFEVRNLRQLERFVETVAAPRLHPHVG